MKKGNKRGRRARQPTETQTRSHPPIPDAAFRGALGLAANSDEDSMRCALELGESVRGNTAPNPWVGAVLVTGDGRRFDGATEPPPGRHAEIVALDCARDAGSQTHGATIFTTLEPCSHTGRTPPCAQAIIDAGVSRAVVGMADPDPNVSGQGIEMLQSAGVEVTVGVLADEVQDSLRAYLHQRRSGRPWVVLKLAATLDGRIAAPDGTSQWITSPQARADAHALRARCDSVLVGAATVRADDPSLTVRDAPGHPGRDGPRRFVLGTAPPGAKVHPCTEVAGSPAEVLADLGADAVIELLIEGGASVAGAFHRASLVNEYVIYLAPKLSGGDDSLAMFAGPSAATISDFWSGEITETLRLGPDLRITLMPQAQAGTVANPAEPIWSN